MGRKRCKKRRNCLLPAISPFPTKFWKRLVLQTFKNKGLFGKGLTLLLEIYHNLYLQKEKIMTLSNVWFIIWVISQEEWNGIYIHASAKNINACQLPGLTWVETFAHGQLLQRSIFDMSKNQSFLHIKESAFSACQSTGLFCMSNNQSFLHVKVSVLSTCQRTSLFCITKNQSFLHNKEPVFSARQRNSLFCTWKNQSFLKDKEPAFSACQRTSLFCMSTNQSFLQSFSLF